MMLIITGISYICGVQSYSISGKVDYDNLLQQPFDIHQYLKNHLICCLVNSW